LLCISQPLFPFVCSQFHKSSTILLSFSNFNCPIRVFHICTMLLSAFIVSLLAVTATALPQHRVLNYWDVLLARIDNYMSTADRGGGRIDQRPDLAAGSAGAAINVCSGRPGRPQVRPTPSQCQQFCARCNIIINTFQIHLNAYAANRCYAHKTQCFNLGYPFTQPGVDGSPRSGGSGPGGSGPGDSGTGGLGTST
jgi:hypothetical protein